MKCVSMSIILVCGVFCSSCTTKLESYKVVVEKDLIKPTGVASYYLKRQDFGIRLTRELISCEMKIKNNKPSTSPISIKSEIIPILGADSDYRFSIPYDTLSSGSKTSSLDIEFYPDRTIKSINAKIEDKTAEIIESVASIVGTVALGVTTGGLAGLSQERTVDNLCTPEAKKNIDTLKESKKKINYFSGEIRQYGEEIEIAKLVLTHKNSDVKEVWSKLNDLKTQIREKEKEIAKEQSNISSAKDFLTDISYHMFKPDWPKKTDSDSKDKKNLFTTTAAYPLSTVRQDLWFKKENEEMIKKATNIHIALVLQSPASSKEDSKTNETPKFPQPPKVDMSFTDIKPINGLLFREPVEGDIFVCLGKACSAEAEVITTSIDKARREIEGVAASAKPDESIAAQALAVKDAAAGMSYKGRFVVPQAGAILNLTLENGPFEENSVSLAFSDDGRITKFSYGENAALAAAMTSLANTAQTGAEAFQGVKNADLEKLKFENDELEAKKNKLEILKELRKLEAEGIQ